MSADDIGIAVVMALLFLVAPAVLCWHLGTLPLLVPYYLGVAWVAR